MQTFLCGLLAVLAACWFWYYQMGNPLHELALIHRRHTVAGFIVDSWEEAESPGERSGTLWYHGGAYRYRLPDGREFTQHTKSKSGRLKAEFQNLKQPYSIQVECLPDNPRISRIKGDGCDSVMELLWRKVGLGGLMLVLFLSPGAVLVLNATRDIKRLGAAQKLAAIRYPERLAPVPLGATAKPCVARMRRKPKCCCRHQPSTKGVPLKLKRSRALPTIACDQAALAPRKRKGERASSSWARQRRVRRG